MIDPEELAVAAGMLMPFPSWCREVWATRP
jgi:hypothetical protein